MAGEVTTKRKIKDLDDLLSLITTKFDLTLPTDTKSLDKFLTKS